MHVHGSSGFLFLGKFLRFVLNDFNLFFRESVDLVDRLADLLVRGVNLELDYSLLVVLSYQVFVQAYYSRGISVVWPRSSLTTTNFPSSLGVNCSFAFSNSIP